MDYKPAAILKDAQGNVVGLDHLAFSGGAIAEAERRSAAAMRAPADAEAERKYADQYAAGNH